MSNGETNGNGKDARISLSEAKLDQKLAELKVDLIRELAPKEDLRQVERRVLELERVALVREGPIDRQVSSLEARVESLESMREEFEEVTTEVETLNRDKVAKEAVEDYKHYIVGGGLLAALIMIGSFLINAYQLFF